MGPFSLLLTLYALVIHTGLVAFSISVPDRPVAEILNVEVNGEQHPLHQDVTVDRINNTVEIFFGAVWEYTLAT